MIMHRIASNRAFPILLLISVVLPATASAVEPGYWGGKYIGIHGGYGFNNNVTVDSQGARSGLFDLSGTVGGGQLGYIWTANNEVLGVEVNASGANVDGTIACPLVASNTCGVKIDRLYKLQINLGMSLDQVMVYGTMGAASARIEAREETPLTTYADSANQTGWLLGVGGALAFSDKWSGGLEVQFINFGSNDYTVNGATVAVENQLFTANLGLNYRF
jgi:outer membrane immunogenic protein